MILIACVSKLHGRYELGSICPIRPKERGSRACVTRAIDGPTVLSCQEITWVFENGIYRKNIPSKLDCFTWKRKPCDLSGWFDLSLQ